MERRTEDKDYANSDHVIDIHNGQVKQIVGGSPPKDQGDQAAENLLCQNRMPFYAGLYKKAGLKGGHVIPLNGKGFPIL